MIKKKSKQLKAGQEFGRLTVVKLAYVKRNKYNQNIEYYLVKCVCGNEKIIVKTSLTANLTRSCGCLKQEILHERNIKHSLKGTRLYSIWKGIKARCYNKNNPSYDYYGGRGVRVCKEWLSNPKAFCDWAMEKNYKDNLTIDRIDNNGNYEPSNCRWATMKEQSRNKRNNRIITHKGEARCLNEWSEITGLKRETIKDRIKRGWSVEYALTKPINSPYSRDCVIDYINKNR